MAEFVLVGPGRAGLSLGIALVEKGHTAVGVLGRDPGRAKAGARRLDSSRLSWEAPLPEADLAIVAVRDDAITEVAGRLAPQARRVRAAVHLSGLTPASALQAMAGAGVTVGAFHPLQTLPDPTEGAAALSGAWVAVTAEDPWLQGFLENLARSIGMRPFVLEDERRALYHAAAAASSNYLITALAIAEELFTRAGVPFDAAGPLVEAVSANAFRLGPRQALTGPIARGDVGTVRGHLEAVQQWAPELVADFRSFARATARLAGTEDLLREVL